MAKKAKKTGAEADAADRKAETVAKKIVSRAGKAGLILSVSRTDKRLRSEHNRISKRVGGMTSVYITGVVETVLERALDLAGKEALAGDDEKAKRVTPQHLVAAIQMDADLARHFLGYNFPSHVEVPRATLYISSKDDLEKRKQEKEARAAEKEQKKQKATAAGGDDATD